MNQTLRILLFLPAAALFGLLVVGSLSGLPHFGKYGGPYGDMVLRSILELRHTPQGVAAVTFDFRGFDTLGEEFILFAAVAGSLLLMREQKGEHNRKREDHGVDRAVMPVNDGVHAAGAIMFPFTLLLGIYIVVHGHLTPGGGFQGGVLLATAFYFIYLSGEYADLTKFIPDHLLDLLEAAGAAGLAVIAFVPLLLGQPFMKNMLPLGKAGDLLSAGIFPLCNIAVGTEVAAGFLLLVSSFLRQMLLVRKGR